MTEYDAVVFDNDGVLVEPPIYDRQLEAARLAFAEHGLESVDDGHLDAIASGVTHEDLHAVCDVHDVDVDSLWAARNRHDQRIQHEDLVTGARSTYDDVAAIEDLGVDCGVVSNNHHATVEFVLDHGDLEPLFETYYGREPSVDGLRRKKPNPHFIECALEDLGAETALYVGDRESDVVAANNAGLDSAFLRRDHTRSIDLGAVPSHEVESLRELPRLLDGG